MRRTLARSSLFALGLLAGAAIAVSRTAMASVEYDFAGGNFTSVAAPYTTSDQVTGEVILPNPLPPSTAGIFFGSPSDLSFSFSDGVNTITNSNVTPQVGNGFGFSFSTNAADQIIGSSFYLTSSVFNSHTWEIFDQGDESAGSTASVVTGPGGVVISSSSGQGYNFTPGTWSGPMTVSVPPPSGPSLYLTVITDSNPATQSLSGHPTEITAALTLATAPPAGSIPVPLTKALSSSDLTLQEAANDLGYIGFDWAQVLMGPSPLPYYACQEPSCPGSDSPVGAEIKGSTPDPPPPFGFDYCNPFSPNYIRGDCRHSDYYDQTTAEEPSLSDSFCINNSSSGCITFLTENSDTTFNYFDSPTDPCLRNQFSSSNPNFPAAVGDSALAYQANLYQIRRSYCTGQVSGWDNNGTTLILHLSCGPYRRRRSHPR